MKIPWRVGWRSILTLIWLCSEKLQFLSGYLRLLLRILAADVRTFSKHRAQTPVFRAMRYGDTNFQIRRSSAFGNTKKLSALCFDDAVSVVALWKTPLCVPCGVHGVHVVQCTFQSSYLDSETSRKTRVSIALKTSACQLREYVVKDEGTRLRRLSVSRSSHRAKQRRHSALLSVLYDFRPKHFIVFFEIFRPITENILRIE